VLRPSAPWPIGSCCWRHKDSQRRQQRKSLRKSTAEHWELQERHNIHRVAGNQHAGRPTVRLLVALANE
jgi:hypothetical protein